MSIFGNTSANQTTANTTGLFGAASSTNGGGVFGNNQQQHQSQQQKPFSFGTSQTQPLGGSLFGGSSIQQQNNASNAKSMFSFGQQSQQQPQQQPQQQEAQPQRPLDQTLRFGTSGIDPQNVTHGMWEEGRGLGVYRSIPAQINVIKDKWDAATLSSPLRTYVYKHTGDEKEALRYRPDPGEDENKWEEAVSKRPGPEWVPLLVRGFNDMGMKTKQQMEAIARCNMILHEINTSLELQLETHNQKVAARLAECKRRQIATSRRTLALAVKVQILRKKGYVMDNAEDELKSKLEKLEREICDPSLDAREQEIWARMLGIRERAKRLKSEMDKLTPSIASEEPVLDETTIKTAKEVRTTVQSRPRSSMLICHRSSKLTTRNCDTFTKSFNWCKKNMKNGRKCRMPEAQTYCGELETETSQSSDPERPAVLAIVTTVGL